MSYSCERKCACKGPHRKTNLVVLTGGPGAGKTAVLEFVRKMLCEHVAVLPEAASILFAGGFWRFNSPSAKISAQKAIYHVQNEIQNLVINEHRWALGLCDRGTLDGLAYWPKSPKSFFESLDTSLGKEYAKYKAVIHLQSPSKKQGYNHQNPYRTETAELAARIDQRIHQVWKKHPNYYLIESAVSFGDKVNEAVKLIQNFLPDCCKEQHLRD